ncbi:MAG: VRR-NUC domain-containing protein [Candidatus Hadarchaeum sp.]
MSEESAGFAGKKSRSRRGGASKESSTHLFLTLNEKQWQKTVVDLARTLGYRVYHPWLSIRSEKGWPDLALFKPGRFLLAELKTERGKLTPSQEQMIADLRAAGVEVHVWRPSDFEKAAKILAGEPCTMGKDVV